MNNLEKERFQQLLNNTFNNNLKDVNDALDKHITIMNNKKQANKIAYVKHKEDNEFKKKQQNMINNIIKIIKTNY